MITLINNHVLFPHLADWASPPDSQRTWQTEVSEALPGSETRQALRAGARRTLSYSFTARTIQERARFDARWDAALKNGKACCPFFGRGAQLASNAAAVDDSLTVLPGAWNWQAGDYVALINSETMFDVIQISSVVGAVLDLSSFLTYAWPAGWTVYPLLFGKLTSDKATALTSWHETMRLTLTQLVAERTVQLGTLTAPGSGIGAWKIGTTFTVS